MFGPELLRRDAEPPFERAVEWRGFGDLFAWLCVAGTVIAVVAGFAAPRG